MAIRLIDDRKVPDAVIPVEIAKIFSNMASWEQASFFNEVASIFASWGEAEKQIQVQAIRKSKHLTQEGAALLQSLGHKLTNN